MFRKTKISIYRLLDFVQAAQTAEWIENQQFHQNAVLEHTYNFDMHQENNTQYEFRVMPLQSHHYSLITKHHHLDFILLIYFIFLSVGVSEADFPWLDFGFNCLKANISFDNYKQYNSRQVTTRCIMENSYNV